MQSRPHRSAMLGLALSLGLLSISACRPKETAPDFLNKSKQGSSALSESGVKAQGLNGEATAERLPGSAVASKIDLNWVEQAIPEAIIRTGSEQGNLFLPETTGGGIAALDYDRDGWTDVFCAGGGFADVAKRVLLGSVGSLHRGIGQGRFEHVSAAAQVDLSNRYSAGLSVGDYDGDGFLDVFVTGYSIGQLLRNQGDGTFQVIDGSAIGLDDVHWGASAAFFDADSDGLSDLYVANYADWSFDNNPVCGVDARFGKGEKSTDYCGPREFKGLPDVLYRNHGDGTFGNRNSSSGIDDHLRGLGVLAADFDEDGDVDLYVSNDVDPNLLYRNDGDFQFTEVARRSGVATNDAGTPEGSMGIAFGDYNLDGKQDLWITNYQNELNALYRNNGKLQFNYASINARVASTDEATVGWGTAFADMDCDGDEDLVVVNGHIELKPLGSTYEQRPQVLENLSGKTFQLVPRKSKFLEVPQSCRGLALADFNRDGKMDFVASRLNTEAALVLNTSQGGQSIRIRLVGTQSNRDAIGARVRLQIGSMQAIRQMIGGGSYASTSDHLIHFGVPDSAASEAQIQVHWPSGKTERWILADWQQEWILVEGQSTK